MHHINLFRIGSLLLQRVQRAGEQRVGNEAVEAADNDGEPEAGGAQFAVEALVAYVRSFARKYCLPLLQKGARSFVPVVRCRCQTEGHGFKSQARIESAVESAIDRFHGQCYSERAIGGHFARPLFCSRDQMLLRGDAH